MTKKSVKSSKETKVKSANPKKDISIKELSLKIAKLIDFKGEILWDASKPDGTPKKLLDVKDMIGKWNDILIHINSTSKDSGFYKIWVNGNLKYEYNGAITGGKENYFKFGIYQTKVSVWPMYHPDTPYPTQVVYYDEIRAGKSRQAVTKFIKN